MITSRTADKHRNRATELGVERFLGKPYQEDELLQSLRAVTSSVPSRTAASSRRRRCTDAASPINARRPRTVGAGAGYGVCIGRGGRATGSHSMRSYSAITCAPISSTSAAISSDSSTTIAVVSEP